MTQIGDTLEYNGMTFIAQVRTDKGGTPIRGCPMGISACYFDKRCNATAKKLCNNVHTQPLMWELVTVSPNGGDI